MGRELRMVPPGWEHPKDGRGRYVPLLAGPYARKAEFWDFCAKKWNDGLDVDYGAYIEAHKAGKAVDYYDIKAAVWKPKSEAALKCPDFASWHGDRPKADDHMPDFEPGTATMLVMYENTSEGTPISPAFATAEELARWLADTGASAFAHMAATYDQWLATIGRGWAVSGMFSPATGLVSGVEGLHAADKSEL